MGLVGNKMKQLLSDLDDKVNNDRGKVLKSIQESVDYLNEFVHSNNDVFVDFLSNVRKVYEYAKISDKPISFEFNDKFIKLNRLAFGSCYLTVLDGHTKCHFDILVGNDKRVKTEFEVLYLEDYYDHVDEDHHYNINLNEKVELSKLTFKDLNIIDRDMKEFIKDMNPYIDISVEDRFLSAIENIYKTIEL